MRIAKVLGVTAIQEEKGYDILESDKVNDYRERR